MLIYVFMMNRRDFLQRLAGFTAASAISPFAEAGEGGFSFGESDSFIDETANGTYAPKSTFSQEPRQTISEPTYQPKEEKSCVLDETEEERLARLEELCNYPHHSGWHSKKSPIVGVYAGVLREYTKFALKNRAFRRFGNAAYLGIVRDDLNTLNMEIDFSSCMVPVKYAADADKISHDLYKRYLAPYAKYGLTIENAVQFTHDCYQSGNVETVETESCETTWHLVAQSHPTNWIFTEKDNYWLSSQFLIAIHELEHVKRIRKGEIRFPEYNPTIYEERTCEETAPAIQDIINIDYVRKVAQGVHIDSFVEYETRVPSDFEEGIPVGLVANTFRDLKRQYGTIERALMSTEGQRFVLKYYSNEMV